MKWGRQQHRQQREQEEHPTSAFSLFRVFPLSWISKLRPARSKLEPVQPTIPERTTTTPTGVRPRSQTLPASKPRPNPPEFRTRDIPPPRLSPERPLRRSSASDHLSFSPAVLDRLVSRAHEGSDEATRRHSCAGDDDAHFFVRDRSRVGRPFESARFHGAWTEPDFSLPSCRSCRADPERPQGSFSRSPDPSSETDGSEEDDHSRGHRRGSEVATRRRPARVRRITGGGPSPPKDPVFARGKPSHGVPTEECVWRRRGMTEKGRRQPSAAEPAADDQRGGARRSFSFSGKMRHRSKVKVYSPRAAAAARAAKERNARKKVAAVEEDKRCRRGRSLESFAVVKCSMDPQEDFRESMMEMIQQTGIGRPEEMEGLLACYLALNADEYHDVIVKVFRQVWLDVRPTRLLSRSIRRGGDNTFHL